jgi:hypothetical protein
MATTTTSRHSIGPSLLISFRIAYQYKFLDFGTPLAQVQKDALSTSIGKPTPANIETTSGEKKPRIIIT